MNTPQQQTNHMREQFKFALKEKFDEKKFDSDIQSGHPISMADMEKYKKKDPKEVLADKMRGPKGLFYVSRFQNGYYIAKGSDGRILKCKSFEELAQQMSQIFKESCLKNNKEPECTFRTNSQGKMGKYKKEVFARTFIGAGIVVKGDLPENTEFWKKLKSDYLAQKGHTEAEWNRLTRFVPPKFMAKEKPKAQMLVPQQRVMRAHSGR